MDDEALDELESRLASLRTQALEQIALSQRIRRELERAAGAAPVDPVRGARPGSARPRHSAREIASRAPAPGLPSALDGAPSWRTLGTRLRHRMRCA